MVRREGFCSGVNSELLEQSSLGIFVMECKHPPVLVESDIQIEVLNGIQQAFVCDMAVAHYVVVRFGIG